MRSSYIVEATSGGWRVCRVNIENGLVDSFDAVVHRRRAVALAYADAAESLEHYLGALDRGEDAADLFEAWRRLDDRYELLSLEARDAPLLVEPGVWTTAAPTSQSVH